MVDAFDESKHVVSWREVDKKWKRCLGADFGDRNGAEVGLVWDPDAQRYMVIGENWPGKTRTFEMIAADIRQICGRTPDVGAGGNRTTEQGWRQSYRKEGIPIEEPVKEHADPKLQYKCVNDAFANGDLVVMENCPKLINMLNELQRKIDPNTGQVTDEFDDSSFHLCSALRYIVTKLLPPKPKFHSNPAQIAPKVPPPHVGYTPR